MSIDVRRAAIALSAICFVSAACSTLIDLEPPVEPLDAGSDANAVDAGAPDSSPSDAGDAGVETYSTLDDPNAWEFFNGSALGNSGFSGGAFDGRFVYFAPSGFGSRVVRYDTSQPFTAPVAWSEFNTTGLTGLSYEVFSGATFDGTYVYFVPRQAPPLGGGGGDYLSGDVVRFDTRSPDDFEADAGTGAWSIFDTTTLASDNGEPVGGFAGATFDGHYLYFVPDGAFLAEGGFLRDGLVARFDPTGNASLSNAAQWMVFDSATTNDAAVGYFGGVFDGRYLNLVPYRTAGNANNGLAVRFDVTAPFQDAAAWSSFDLTANVNASATSFATGAFDGRYVYFAPYATTVATRFDTQSGGFENAGSWPTYNLLNVINSAQADAAGSPAAAHFSDVAFDGRYVYFSSDYNPDPIVVRYDTQAAFDDAAGWSAIDVKTANLNSTLNGGFVNLGSAVFDGQYLYFASENGSAFARFKTKSLPAQPKLPAYYGSTY